MRHAPALALSALAAVLAGCSGGSTTTATSAVTSAAPPSASSVSSTSRVALPAATRWVEVPALHSRLAVPTTWQVLDLAALRDQVGTPAFAAAADRLGYTVDELTSFTSSGAVAMAVGPDSGDTAPNLLLRSVAGGSFASGEQLTRATRGATGVLDAQSRPTTPAGPAVRGDIHMTVDGSVVHASQLAVTVGQHQDVVTVSGADAATVKKVMDIVVGTYSAAR